MSGILRSAAWAAIFAGTAVLGYAGLRAAALSHEKALEPQRRTRPRKRSRTRAVRRRAETKQGHASQH
jgi:hypothetical protein